MTTCRESRSRCCARGSHPVDQADRAVEVLSSKDFEGLDADRRTTASLLLGAAYVRLGQANRGAALLGELMDEAADTHSTIRAELALNLGIAWFRFGDLDEATRLFAQVPQGADIIHARALAYTGWVAQARGNFREPLRPSMPLSSRCATARTRTATSKRTRCSG